MSLYDLPKDILIQIILKIEKPRLTLRIYDVSPHGHRYYMTSIGPFYDKKEIIEYLDYKYKDKTIREKIEKVEEYQINNILYSIFKLNTGDM